MKSRQTTDLQADIIDFDGNGFVLLPGFLQDADIKMLVSSIEMLMSESTSLATPGLRRLLNFCPAVRALATGQPLSHLITAALGEGAQPVRAILFDKSSDANWYVTWHQDLSIPVTTRMEIPGFGPWSVKEGVVHVQPPAKVLEKMVSARIHLDDCDLGNGEIKFIPGSHKVGYLDPEAISVWKNQQQVVSCPAKRGDIILMRPLILHSSSKLEQPTARRVLHIEYTNAALPAGLEWAEG